MPISIRFDPETEKRLAALAQLTGRTKSYYIKQAVDEKLDELEDIYMAEYRLENPSGKTWTLEQLVNEEDVDHND